MNSMRQWNNKNGIYFEEFENMKVWIVFELKTLKRQWKLGNLLIIAFDFYL